MTLQEIKQQLASERKSSFEHLIMEEQYQAVKLPDGTLADVKVIPPVLTPWLRHWDNVSRTEVIIHTDVYDFILANRETPLLTLSSEVVDKPKGGGQPFVTYFIAKMKNIRGTL